MKVISNATPLIVLSKINKLYLLNELFGEITVPEEVYKEVIIYGRDKIGVESLKEAQWIKQEKIKDELAVEVLLTELDRGEAEAIILAKENDDSLLLIDNKKPYNKAKLLGIKVQRTLSILISCYHKGLISDFKKIIDEIKAKGFWISEEIYQEVLR
jgi:hypothetical protein